MNIKTSANYIKKKLGNNIPKILLVLGSGLHGISKEVYDEKIILYEDIPGFLKSTAPGHEGKLICGKISGIDILVMSGRFHYYEGYEPEQIAFPIRVFKTLGIEIAILTNASGGVNLDYSPGQFMLINDHINFSGVSVLRGKNDDSLGTRFPDLSNIYTKELLKKTKQIVLKYTGNVHEGVYAFMPGPNYETPAEVRALRNMGADAVGMSTVLEATAASHAGIKVIGISCITNMAAGITDKKLDGEEVIYIGKKMEISFKNILNDLVLEL